MNELIIETKGRGAVEITQQINDIIAAVAERSANLCHIFVAHTSASLMITANEYPDLLLDIEDFLAKIAPDTNSDYRHNNADDSDVSGHLRSILTGDGKTIPIKNQQLALGNFQGVFLYEHRGGGHQRKIIITLLWVLTIELDENFYQAYYNLSVLLKWMGKLARADINQNKP